MYMCFYWKQAVVVLCSPPPAWLTNYLQCCHGDEAVDSLLLCPKQCLRNEACEFPFVIIKNTVKSEVSPVSELTTLSQPLFLLCGEAKVLPRSASVLATLLWCLSVQFPVSSVLGVLCGPLGWFSPNMSQPLPPGK